VELQERYYRFRRGLADNETRRLIELVEMHINMALIQNERIAEDRAEINSPSYRPENRAAFVALFADIHFFLVAADDIRKCVDRLNPRLNGELKTVMKKYRFFFDAVQEMRDHHEHVDERLDGDELYSGKDLVDWTYGMCGSSVKVGPPARQLLLRFYDDAERALENWRTGQPTPPISQQTASNSP
jgi:hypothetical protein